MTEYCPICHRVLGEVNIDEHHLIPKTFKGKHTIRMHRICHQKIHATWSERELLHVFNTVEMILSNEEMQKFVKWVAKKPPEYYDSSKDTCDRKSKRKR